MSILDIIPHRCLSFPLLPKASYEPPHQEVSVDTTPPAWDHLGFAVQRRQDQDSIQISLESNQGELPTLSSVLLLIPHQTRY